MTFLRFQDPYFLALLLLLPLFIWSRRRSKKIAFSFPSLQTMKTADGATHSFIEFIPDGLKILTAILLILVLARPQEGKKMTEILSRGVDIVLAIDVSGSMRALDFSSEEQRITRLDVVKDVVSQFIDQRDYDRMGMVVFGAEAYTQCPLTLDHSVLRQFLDQLEIGMAGDATAIGSAIAISAKRLKDLESKSKVVILLTDGLSNAGAFTPLQAAELAAAHNIKVYSIGVGTRGQAPFLVDTFLGPQYVYQDVEIDEESLKQVSALTGGKYFRATDPQSLTEIYEQIDRLEKSEVKTFDHSEYKELYPYFLIPALLLMILDLTLSQTLLRRIP
ncbi:MAG: VWA domain-containing protein [Candidatus Nitrohelix vancouverensis]|uniref:VWA domain-containing protein n=1 Tax=Candidatus Nitrohelix vancouverensis TaxID=2705534 RepID=A0A7T0C321_9BACT|nr:MAG: VWA domain-containing protein [Candidatus Nitrohelix vancouverensis]